MLLLTMAKENLAIFGITKGVQPSRSPPPSTKPLMFNDVARLKGQHSVHHRKRKYSWLFKKTKCRVTLDFVGGKLNIVGENRLFLGKIGRIS